MICVIDAGNTRLKWQCQPDDAVQAVAWADEKDWSAYLVDALGGQKIKRFVIAAVADESRQVALEAVLSDRWPKAKRDWLKPKAKCCGVRLAYPDPMQLGVDRWCALIGARVRYPRHDALIMGAGSAITVDYLRADGQHVGGMILPSLAAMRLGLNQMAPRLAAAWEAPGSLADGGILAVDTAGALHLGSRFMLASAITQLVDGVSAAERSTPKVLLTGGDAAVLAGWMTHPCEELPTLTCDGARHIVKHQR